MAKTHNDTKDTTDGFKAKYVRADALGVRITLQVGGTEMEINGKKIITVEGIKITAGQGNSVKLDPLQVKAIIMQKENAEFMAELNARVANQIEKQKAIAEYV